MNERLTRHDVTCPLCLGVKNLGLVLCWSCHRSESRANGGQYSAFAERRIAAHERYLEERARTVIGTFTRQERATAELLRRLWSRKS